VVGLGAQYRSKTFIADSYCKAFYTAEEDPFRRCRPGQTVRVFFNDPGHVVLSANLGYEVNSNLRFDVQADNLLDKTYYDQVGGLSAGNWYGAPRSFKISMRTKF